MSILKHAIGNMLRGLASGANDGRDEGATNPFIDYLESHPEGRMVHRWLHYFDIYHRHFAPFRGQALTMIEIGVFNGGSLPMWRDYFGPQASDDGGHRMNQQIATFEELYPRLRADGPGSRLSTSGSRSRRRSTRRRAGRRPRPRTALPS